MCLILVPALDLQIRHFKLTEGLDKGLSQARIRNQRRVKIDGSAADSVVVVQLALGQVLGDVDDRFSFRAVS